MTYYQICNISNMKGATSGAGTVYPFRTPELPRVFRVGSCCSVFSFLCRVLYIIVCPFSFCHCIVCLSMYGFWLSFSFNLRLLIIPFFQFMAFDYPFLSIYSFWLSLSFNLQLLIIPLASSNFSFFFYIQHIIYIYYIMDLFCESEFLIIISHWRQSQTCEIWVLSMIVCLLRWHQWRQYNVTLDIHGNMLVSHFFLHNT